VTHRILLDVSSSEQVTRSSSAARGVDTRMEQLIGGSSASVLEGWNDGQT
jgi:hypothetical protein